MVVDSTPTRSDIQSHPQVLGVNICISTDVPNGEWEAADFDIPWSSSWFEEDEKGNKVRFGRHDVKESGQSQRWLRACAKTTKVRGYEAG